MSKLAMHLGRIGMMLNDIGPRAEKFEKGTVFIEGGPMLWKDGNVRGQVFGPYNTADAAHNYVAVKIERHRIANAKYHGETGTPPNNDREYFGHPGFQYRIMPAEEYFSRYCCQIQLVANQALMELFQDDEPEIFHPAQDGTEEGIPDGGILDEDEMDPCPVHPLFNAEDCPVCGPVEAEPEDKGVER